MRPSGSVTFLFTDVESSTRRWERDPAEMQVAHARQEAIMRAAIGENNGYAYKMVGDAFQSAFATPIDALKAALQAQRALRSENWGEGGELRVRMALHTGVTEEREGDYFGPPLNRAHRLMSAAHGGQVLISQATQQLLRDTLPPLVTLLDMGEHRLKDLSQPERIFQLVAPGILSEFPPLRTLEGRPNNLPVQPNPLIGRDEEVEAVASRLRRDDVRLLTLTGVGGIGKTRLAMQVAAELLDGFEDGVFFVNLAPIADPSLVISAIALTLDLREAGGQPIGVTLKNYLKEKRILLVLDNFEQVLDAAPQVADLLKAAPRLKALVTSRAALNLSMEGQYAVLPLAVPHPKEHLSPDELSQYDAVRLFVQRATAVKPGFELNSHNAADVAGICYRLEGIPLAIELAAARIKALPPHALLVKLSSRLRLLTGGARDLPSRQQTLRNTIGWSYDLLSEDEQRLFRMLGVFKGGCTLEALESLSSPDYADRTGASLTSEFDLLDGTTSLVDKSLVYCSEGVSGDARYGMLETIREFALEKLEECGEARMLRARHADHFMRLAEEGEQELIGPRQAEWLAMLTEEHDNIRVALRWAREAGDPDAALVGLRMAGALWQFWYVRGHLSEGRDQLASLAELGVDGCAMEDGPGQNSAQPGPSLYRAKALHGTGTLAWQQGDYRTARALFEESLRLRRELGDKKGIAASLNNLGGIAYEQGDYHNARLLFEGSLAIQRERGDKWGVSAALGNVGLAALQEGDYEGARALQEETLALHRELGDKRGISIALNNLALVPKAQGDYATALALFEEALGLRREIGDKAGIGSSLSNIGSVAQEQGNYSLARALFEESLTLRREVGDKWGIAASLAGLAGVAVARSTLAGPDGTPDEALAERGARLLGAVDSLLKSMDAAFDSDDRDPYERALASARELLGEVAFTRAWEAGRGMSIEAAMSYALQES
jgi:predicted ATPase/class 3 adenylate cyclase